MKTVEEIAGCNLLNKCSVQELQEFIDAVDAERGKDAVAWRNKLHTHSGGYFSFSERKPDCSSTEPLFLSPTIPPNMVLVPVEPTKEIRIAIWDALTEQRPSLDGVWEKLIQAAGLTK